MSQPSKFRVTTPKLPINPEAMEKFANAVGESPVQTEKNISKGLTSIRDESLVPEVRKKTEATKQTKAMLIKLTPEQFDRFEEVFAASTFKSKQSMGEKFIVDGLEALGRKLGM